MTFPGEASLLSRTNELIQSGVLAEIKPPAFVTWLCLASHKDKETRIAKLETQNIAEMTGQTVNKVLECLSTLEKKGLLVVIEPGKYELAV